ncbi:MAG TPA: hypothetical protein VHT03_10280 [Rhizomicrobium sp.]|jgi:hypothetical protein|nr:hypothetical protein [Rhizomicrobium sp.]
MNTPLDIPGRARRLDCRLAVIASCFLSVVAPHGASAVGARRAGNLISVTLDGKPEVVIPPTAFNCQGHERAVPDTPDVQVNMFHDAGGRIHVFAHNHLNFAFIEMASGRIVHPDCTPMLDSRLDPDPRAFADREWLTSPYTVDGKLVYSLIHDEYWGSLHQRPGCKPLDRAHGIQSCFYVAMTLARSLDGGNHFESLYNGGQSFVATVPYRFAPAMTRAGYGNPSNIIRDRRDGNFYVFFEAFDYLAQHAGTCLMRSADLLHWRYWNGTSFDGVFVNPYAASADASQHVCAVVMSQLLSSVVHHRVADLFVGVIPRPRYMGGGVALTSSSDLLNWSAPVLTMPDPPGGLVSYPSLIEPDLNEAGRNFENIDDHPYLYYVLLTGRQRTVMRVRLKLGTSPRSGL